MTTIRVQCETCQATLRVRDEGFVGEVHACPRCGSMVLIAGASPAPNETVAPSPEAVPPAPVVLGLSETLETLEAPPIEPPPEPPTEQVAAEEAIEPPPPARSNLAPLLTTLTALTATAAIGLAWLFGGSAEPVATPQPADTPQATEPTPPAPAPAAEQDATLTNPVPSLPPADPSPEPLPAEPSATEPPAAGDLPPTQQAPPRIASRDLPRAERLPAAEPISRQIDPLAFDPDQIDFALVGEPPQELPAAEPPAPAELPASASPLPVRDPAPIQARDGVFVRLGSSGELPTRSADLALAETISRIELRDVPLAEACRLVGELAGTPVTLPADALRRAGVSVGRPVNLSGSGRELGELFGEALGSARLAYTVDGPHLIVVRKGSDQRRTVTHRLADLVGDSPASLTAELRQSVGGLLEISATGELPLTAPMRTHYDLLVAAERLRFERGLPSGSKYPRELLAESPEQVLGPKLDRRATFSFVDPTPLSEVFAYWRRAIGSEVLVDWRALAEAGLGPRSTITCSATNRPWRSALSGVLEPLGLTWRPAFGPAIEIGVTEHDFSE